MIALNEWITPDHLFFQRNHFSYPVFDIREWHLSIDGSVATPARLLYSALKHFPHITLPVTVECAGNKRGLFTPNARGEQWELGAISHAAWTGIPLKHVLEFVGLRSDATEILFEGIDTGERSDLPGLFPYARSLPLEKAVHPHTILALYKNGKPLTYRHGFPLRLIVPGWYGMASVKWLRRITVLNQPFQGPFQSLDYVMILEPGKYQGAIPITNVKVNSSFVFPSNQSFLHRGVHILHGVAWSGISPVAVVEVSEDEGQQWSHADWCDPSIPYSWRRWKYRWKATQPGTYTLKVKATDRSGQSQPEKAQWNVKGYGNNSIHTITVYID